MGVLQACLSEVRPPAGAPPVTVLKGGAGRSESITSKQLNSDRTAAPPAIGKEWAVVQQAIAGDAHAQEHLFARHAGRLYRTAFALLQNKEDAEDAVQEGLCRAYSNLRFFRGRSSFSTWLTRIVINSALMTRRGKRVRPEASLDEILDNQPQRLPHGVVDARPNPEKHFAAIEIKALVAEHVRQLPRSLRLVFQLGVINGFSAMESSEALGISVIAFKARMFRARRTLVCGLQRRLRLARRR